MLRGRGFSVVELMLALMVVAVLATLAYPGFAHVMLRARRSDAIARLLEMQQSQERWRSSHAAYAPLGALGMPALDSDPDYAYDVPAHGPTGYALQAQARGHQAADTSCRVLRLTVDAGHVTMASGADALVRNDAAANRRCWQR